MAASIRFFERLRRPRGIDRATWRKACAFNHAAVVVKGGPGAVISEEGWRGDVRARLADTAAEAYAVVHVVMDVDQRTAAVAFARDAIGSSYGFLSIAADAFNALTGLELAFSWGDRMVCSTQATRSLERAGLIPDRNPAATTPAHLALWFGASA